jgi:hypothetical protein
MKRKTKPAKQPAKAEVKPLQKEDLWSGAAWVSSVSVEETMTLRDRFAIAIAGGLAQRLGTFAFDGDTAADVWEKADAILAARNKRKVIP